MVPTAKDKDTGSVPDIVDRGASSLSSHTKKEKTLDPRLQTSGMTESGPVSRPEYASWCRSGMRGFGKFRVLLAPEAVWALEVLGVAGDDDLFSDEAGDAE